MPETRPVTMQGEQRTLPESTSTASSDSNTPTSPVARETRDKDYFRRIGKKGGEKTRDTHGFEHLQGIAQKGGQANAKKYKQKPDHFSDIGQKGGETTKKRYGPDHYKDIGSMGGKKPRRKKETPSEPDESGSDV